MKCTSLATLVYDSLEEEKNEVVDAVDELAYLDEVLHLHLNHGRMYAR
jgi:hypothetical protein